MQLDFNLIQAKLLQSDTWYDCNLNIVFHAIHFGVDSVVTTMFSGVFHNVESWICWCVDLLCCQFKSESSIFQRWHYHGWDGKIAFIGF